MTGASSWNGLSAPPSTRDMAAGTPVLNWVAWRVCVWAGPSLALAWLVALAGSFALGGFVMAPAALAPKPERLNPANNLGKLFSLGGTARAFEVAGSLGLCALHRRGHHGSGLGPDPANVPGGRAVVAGLAAVAHLRNFLEGRLGFHPLVGIRSAALAHELRAPTPHDSPGSARGLQGNGRPPGHPRTHSAACRGRCGAGGWCATWRAPRWW